MSSEHNDLGAGMGVDVRRRVQVRGRVQGVGFRFWTVRRARELGVRGTVRNLPDGSVEVVAAGAPEVVERFMDLLRRGPTMAHVEELRELPAESLQLPQGFEVVY